MQKKKTEIELAMRSWSNDMQAMLDNKFGKHKVGHLLILFEFGNYGRSTSWISNARESSLIQFVEHFLQYLKERRRLIITPKESEDEG